MTRIGELTLSWGESLRWDDRRQRLYFVDCATQTLHWLEGAELPLHSMKLPSMPTGVVLTDAGSLVACLDDGLYVVDPDAETSEVLAAYPEGMHGRANDANADGSGNLVTGTLNLVPGPGASWWFSAFEGWRLLDDDIGNANGRWYSRSMGSRRSCWPTRRHGWFMPIRMTDEPGRSVSGECSATTVRSMVHPTAPRPTRTAACGAACSASARSPASPRLGSTAWSMCLWRTPAT
jgi:hypothetical protein